MKKSLWEAIAILTPSWSWNYSLMLGLSLQFTKEYLNYLFTNYYSKKLFVVHVFTLSLNSWCQTSIRNSKSHLNCNWIEWIHVSYLPLLQKLQCFPPIIFPKYNNHKIVGDASAFHSCLPKNWKMPSNSDIPNSISLVIINLTFLKQDDRAMTHPQRCLSVCKLEQQLVLHLPFWKGYPSSNHLFIYSVTITITHHVSGISEMRYLCSELKLIIHFPTEILALTLFLDTSKQGPLPRIQDSWVPGL